MLVSGTKTAVVADKARAKKDLIFKGSQQDIEKWIDDEIKTMDDVKSYLKRVTRAVRASQNNKVLGP